MSKVEIGEKDDLGQEGGQHIQNEQAFGDVLQSRRGRRIGKIELLPPHKKLPTSGSKEDVAEQRSPTGQALIAS